MSLKIFHCECERSDGGSEFESESIQTFVARSKSMVIGLHWFVENGLSGRGECFMLFGHMEAIKRCK